MSRPVYGGSAAGVNINDPSGIYGVGFGPGDARRAIQDGYSARSVLEFLGSWNNGPVTSDARQMLLNESQNQYQSDLRSAMPAYQPPQVTVNTPPPAPTVPAPMAIRGNATGVKSKKSKAEKTGRNASGTNQFNRSMFINPVSPINNINV